MQTDAQKRASKKYQSKFERISIRVSKEAKDAYNAHADKMGESLSSFIKRAIEEAITRDNN